MKNLFLKFVDGDGFEQTVKLELEELIIGRHSGCDLVIPDARLSREHIKIQRFADVFTVSELGSSNGTYYNGEPLDDPVTLESEDVLDLGGGVEISIFIESDEDEDEDSQSESRSVASASAPAPAAGEKQGIHLAFILAPLVGLFVLGGLGIAAILFINSGPTTANGRNESNSPEISRDSEDGPEIETSPNSTTDENPTSTPVDTSSPIGGPDNTATPDTNQPSSPTTDSPDRQTEALVYSFMTRIARNDKRPFMASTRIKEVTARIEQLKSSAALRSNINSAADSSSQIKALAVSKNLQPQFLAAAAIAKLGGSSGNVAATANDMSDVLDRLTIVLSNEMADDSLLVIAAYTEGKAGDTLKMRDRIAGLAKTNQTASPREIRTIWFLRDNGSISADQYNFAVNFLAVGTIMQNPKAFGVNAKEVSIQ